VRDAEAVASPVTVRGGVRSVAAPADLAVSTPWLALTDEASGRVFFYNQVTEECMWDSELPAGATVQSSPVQLEPSSSGCTCFNACTVLSVDPVIVSAPQSPKSSRPIPRLSRNVAAK
jgi:hypothetical protein